MGSFWVARSSYTSQVCDNSDISEQHRAENVAAREQTMYGRAVSPANSPGHGEQLRIENVAREQAMYGRDVTPVSRGVSVASLPPDNSQSLLPGALYGRVLTPSSLPRSPVSRGVSVASHPPDNTQSIRVVENSDLESQRYKNLEVASCTAEMFATPSLKRSTSDSMLGRTGSPFQPPVTRGSLPESHSMCIYPRFPSARASPRSVSPTHELALAQCAAFPVHVEVVVSMAPGQNVGSAR